MKNFLEEISQQKQFDAFIQESLKISTYKPLWKNEIESDYTATGAFNEMVAEYAAASAGSIIAKNAEKPIREMPNIGSIMAVVARMGDRWQLDNERLDKLMQAEGRYRNRSGNFSNEQKASEFAKIVKYAYSMFEPAVIAPHKRIDLLLYNGLSDGKYLVNLANNKDGVGFEVDLKIPRSKLPASAVVFSDHANSDPVAVILEKVNALRGKGKIVTKIQANFKTISDILSSVKIKNSFSVNYDKGKVSPAGIVSIGMLNSFFETVGLPPIELMDVYVTIPGEEEAVNAFKDDRLVFRTASSLGKLMVKDALESYDPHPNKTYSVYEDNLIASYRNEQGRFVEYEMNAIPVFSGKNDIFILETDAKEAA